MDNEYCNIEMLHAQVEEILLQIAANNPGYSEEQLWRALVTELQFLAHCGFLRFGNKPIVAVTGVAGVDLFAVYLYWEIERETEDGLFGYGYAFNLTDPDLSEAGYLFTPSRKWLAENTVDVDQLA